MKKLQSLLSFLFTAATLAIIAGALNNIWTDNGEVEQMAAEAACRDRGAQCSKRVTSWRRTPMEQTFEFETAQQRVTVSCARSLYVFGSYSCTPRSTSGQP